MTKLCSLPNVAKRIRRSVPEKTIPETMTSESRKNLTASAPDENVEYYQTKVLDIWTRFRQFAERPGLHPYTGDEEPGPTQLSLF